MDFYLNECIFKVFNMCNIFSNRIHFDLIILVYATRFTNAFCKNHLFIYYLWLCKAVININCKNIWSYCALKKCGTSIMCCFRDIFKKLLVISRSLKKYKEKYEPQNFVQPFRVVFFRIFKILTTIVRRRMEFIEFCLES